MSSIFESLNSIKVLEINNFNTSKVENISSKLKQCLKISSLDLSNFDISKVVNMSMFKEFIFIPSLDIYHFKDNEVIDMSYMLENCLFLNIKSIS